MIGAGLLTRGMGLLVRRPRLFLLGAIPPVITSVIFTGLLIALITLGTIFAEVIAPYGENEIDLFNITAQPSEAHVLGTDEQFHIELAPGTTVDRAVVAQQGRCRVLTLRLDELRLGGAGRGGRGIGGAAGQQEGGRGGEEDAHALHAAVPLLDLCGGTVVGPAGQVFFGGPKTRGLAPPDAGGTGAVGGLGAGGGGRGAPAAGVPAWPSSLSRSGGTPMML